MTITDDLSKVRAALLKIATRQTVSTGTGGRIYDMANMARAAFELLTPEKIEAVGELEKQRDKLAAVLRRYGNHLPICSIGGLSGCSCGWDEARAKMEEKP